MGRLSSSEHVERQALDAWYTSVRAIAGSAISWSRHEIADAVCFVSSTEPSILINRVLGLGSQTRPTLDQLRKIRKLYADAHVSRFFLHAIPERLGDDYADLLAAAGFEKYRGWMKFERGIDPVGDAQTDFTIAKAKSDNMEDFARIVGDAFDFEPNFQPAIATVLEAAGWHPYMSFDGDTPAGTGGLFMRDGLAYLDFGATRGDFRRRGGQTALLNARIRDALDAGCQSIVTMTGEAVPGEEQHSYRNIERAGFAPTYLRENWIPAQSR